MVPEDVREEAEKLKKELRHHSYLYYVLDKPEISDYEFDHMYRKLVDIEAKYPELVTPDSPTQRVGGKATDDFQKVRFRKPMLSLANAFSADELRDFDRRVKEGLETDHVQYITELKIDGLSMNLIYKNGGADKRRRKSRRRCYKQCKNDSYDSALHRKRSAIYGSPR